MHAASPVVPLLYMLCILAGLSSGSFATTAWLIQIKYITPTCVTTITCGLMANGCRLTPREEFICNGKRRIWNQKIKSSNHVCAYVFHRISLNLSTDGQLKNTTIFWPISRQIDAIWNCTAQIRNCEIANQFQNCVAKFMQFQIEQPSLRDFKIALRKLEIAKLHSAVSKVDVYSNINWACTFS